LGHAIPDFLGNTEHTAIQGDLGIAVAFCFVKIGDDRGLPLQRIGEALPLNTVHDDRALQCVTQRGAWRVYVGVREAGTFLIRSDGQERPEAGEVRAHILFNS
jgi:hypothetical protein